MKAPKQLIKDMISQPYIDLRDPKKHRFGSKEWQDTMIHNIDQKLIRGEDLGPMEKTFMEIQIQHNKKRKK